MRNIFVTLLFSVGLSAFSADTWRVSLTETVISRNFNWAKNEAARLAGAQLSPYYQTCKTFGKPTHTLELGTCQPSGAEDFLCWGRANFSCEMAPFEYILGKKELEGSYFDAAEGAFISIDEKRNLQGTVASPYSGGKALTQLGKLERTGENTYTASGTFSAVQGRCWGRVTFRLTKLSDGNLLFEATSAQRVSSIIFGNCSWKGAVTTRFELKQIHLAQ